MRKSGDVSIFLTWLQSFRPVKLPCSFPSLWNMEQTSEKLPNFSIGIDLLATDPTIQATKIKPKKTRKLHVSQICRKTRSLTLKTFFNDTRVHLVLIFSIFPVNFELFIYSYRLTGPNVLAQTKPWNVACFWQAGGDVWLLFLCVVRILHSITIKGFFAQILVVALL